MIHRYKVNIENTIKKIVRKPIKIKAIGHHDINRHLVYYVKSIKGEECVIKFYFKKNRYNREIYSLINLDKYGIKMPRVLDYGVLRDGVGWIKTEYIEGDILEEIFEDVKRESLLNLYQSIGEQLGRIHSSIEFDSIVDFNSKHEMIKRYDNFKQLMEYYVDSAMNDITKQSLSEKNLLTKAYQNLKDKLSIMTEGIKPCLSHNDFSERNIMVLRVKDEWNLAAIIDFENCIPSDKYMELTRYYLNLKEKDSELAQNFRSGYERFSEIIENDLEEKKKFYRLYFGLEICSWAYEDDPEYYKEGLRYIKESL